ncbi:MAG: serine/threonine protein kinase [Acidimicrobiales bacterium]
MTTPAGASGVARTPAQYFEGDVIDDRYEVIALLGEGGAACVYRVMDREIHEEFALKVYNSTIGEEAALRELTSLMKVSDLRHVVRVFDVARTHSEPRRRYLKMEFVDGTTVAELCRADQTPLGPEDLLHLGDQLLAALEALHPDARRIEELDSLDETTYEEYLELQRLKAEGLVHRDIKPENLVLSSDNVLKVLDFNIAIRPGATVYTQSATPGYAPPDADVTRWDVSVDLFAAGVVLFELAALEHPFVDRSPARQRRLLRSLRSDLPDALENFFEVALAATRTERFRTAHDMRQAWSDALEPTPVEVVEERAPMPSGYTPDPVRNAEAARAGAVEATAELLGLGAQLATARSVAERHGLRQRSFVKSLMLGPASSGTTVLVNIEFRDRDLASVYVNETQWKAVYQLDASQLADGLISPGTHSLTGSELDELLARLDALLASHPPVAAPKVGGLQQRLIEFLRARPGQSFSSEEIASELDVSKRRVGKVLSTLVGESCPQRYRDQVERPGPDRYRAAV